MSEALLDTHMFVFNPEANGGESITLTTRFYSNGDKITDKEGIFINQELKLNSYSNRATIELYGVIITPETLRQLANQLESVENKLRS